LANTFLAITPQSGTTVRDGYKYWTRSLPVSAGSARPQPTQAN